MELSGYIYRCSAGETFDIVARNVYGSEKYAAELMNANPSYTTLFVFKGVEVLSLPAIEVQKSMSANPYTPVKAPWKG